jgi:hypothetical protein
VRFRRTPAMSVFTRVALEILEDPAATLALKQVAVTALLEAFGTGIETPQRAPMAVWRWLLAIGSSSVRFLRTHEIPGADVVRDAISVLQSSDVGEEAWELAAAVIPGQHAAIVSERDIAAIAERVNSDQRARRFAWLVERVYEEHGLSPEFMVALSNRLVASEIPGIREAGVEVGFLARFDEGFALRMLGDPTPAVRTAVADRLERVEEPDRDSALALIRGHFAVERHRTVIATMHHCVGSLVRESGRRVRTLSPPAGGEDN